MGNCVTTPEKSKPAPAVEQRRADPPQTMAKPEVLAEAEKMVQQETNAAPSANNLGERSTQKVTVDESPKTNIKEEITGAKTGPITSA